MCVCCSHRDFTFLLSCLQYGLLGFLGGNGRRFIAAVVLLSTSIAFLVVVVLILLVLLLQPLLLLVRVIVWLLSCLTAVVVADMYRVDRSTWKRAR